MKVGDRVRITIGMIGEYGIAKGELGTVKDTMMDGTCLVHTDINHRMIEGWGDDNAVAGHTLWLPGYALEEINSMGEDKEDLKAVLKMRLKHVSGIGNAKAEKCASVVMEVLDEIVEDYRSEGDKTKTPVDFPWDKVPSEYKWAAWDYDVDEDNTKELHAYTKKPVLTTQTPLETMWVVDEGSSFHLCHSCGIDDCAGADESPIHPSQIPNHLTPSNPEEAREWLFQRPE